MHDIRAIRDDPAGFLAQLQRRFSNENDREGAARTVQAILAIDTARRLAISAAESIKAEINLASKQAGAAKAAGDDALFANLRQMVTRQKDRLSENEAVARDEDQRLRDVLLALPNLPMPQIPDGADESANEELRRVGEPARFNFVAREHYELPAVQGGMDFATAARLSGSRFVVLSGPVARLHRALAQFMLDVHTTENGLTETWTPVLVRDEAMLGTGQLPKFGEDSYQTREGMWLIPTSEVTLTNIPAGQILDEAALPLRFVAHSQCFRSEAGSAGKDTAGMLRQHQFEKVEMVSIVHPDRGMEEHARMTRCAEGILERLGLPYRTVVLSTGDMGAGARITHDLEVWLPGQGRYREVSSVSYCGEWQARRMNARFRPADGGKPDFVHTLNGSGLAVGRALIAVLENGQREDGSVVLPEALRPYVGGCSELTAGGELR